MSSFLHGANWVPTNIREGNALSGFLSLSGGDLTANTWYRLMPHGNTGALVTDADHKLNIGALRSDLLDIDGWMLMILNAGYISQNQIINYANSEVTLKSPIEHIKGLEAAGLQSAIEYALFPLLINPFGINYMPTSADDLDIGWAKADGYAVSDLTIKQSDRVPPNDQLILPFSRIDRLFYRFGSVDAGATYNLSWGEHYRG